jgi:hypothetical protein
VEKCDEIAELFRVYFRYGNEKSGHRTLLPDDRLLYFRETQKTPHSAGSSSSELFQPIPAGSQQVIDALQVCTPFGRPQAVLHRIARYHGLTFIAFRPG